MNHRLRKGGAKRLDRTREHLTPEEVNKLLDGCKAQDVSRNPERDYCILLLMFRHGLRVSEVCSLQLSDVDVKEKLIHVKRLKDCESGTHPLFNGEPRAVAAWLRCRYKMQPQGNTLFVSERRKPLARSAVWALIKKVATAAGLADLNIHPHMLRHACGYNLVNKGTNVRIIQSFLGHKSIQSTARYTALAPKSVREPVLSGSGGLANLGELSPRSEKYRRRSRAKPPAATANRGHQNDSNRQQKPERNCRTV